MQEFSIVFQGDIKSILGADRIDHQIRDPVVFEIFRRGRAGQMIDFLDALEFDLEFLELGKSFEVDRFVDVMLDELEIRIRQEMVDVFFISARKIVDTDDFARLDQLIADVRTDKAGSACDKDVFFFEYRSLGHIILC